MSKRITLTAEDIVLVKVMIRAYEDTRYNLTVAHQQRMEQLLTKLEQGNQDNDLPLKANKPSNGDSEAQ